jgi:mRNA interferase RelE/StbE
MTYQIRIDRDALKTLTALSAKLKRQIGAKIDSLATNPFPPGCKKLDEDLYRIRSGDYRIVYTVIQKQILICILRIGDRKEVYNHLPR